MPPLSLSIVLGVGVGVGVGVIFTSKEEEEEEEELGRRSEQIQILPMASGLPSHVEYWAGLG